MKLSMYSGEPDDYSALNLSEADQLKIVRDRGFTCIDYTCTEAAVSSDWKIHAQAARTAMEESGVVVMQAHDSGLYPQNWAGNLLFHMRGKSACSVYNRKTGKSVRLVLKDAPKGMTREESFDYFQNPDSSEMFDVKPTAIRQPEPDHMFASYKCNFSGETAGFNWIRPAGDQRLCLDCYKSYDRFNV